MSLNNKINDIIFCFIKKKILKSKNREIYDRNLFIPSQTKGILLQTEAEYSFKYF